MSRLHLSYEGLSPDLDDTLFPLLATLVAAGWGLMERLRPCMREAKEFQGMWAMEFLWGPSQALDFTLGTMYVSKKGERFSCFCGGIVLHTRFKPLIGSTDFRDLL